MITLHMAFFSFDHTDTFEPSGDAKKNIEDEIDLDSFQANVNVSPANVGDAFVFASDASPTSAQSQQV